MTFVQCRSGSAVFSRLLFDPVCLLFFLQCGDHLCATKGSSLYWLDVLEITSFQNPIIWIGLFGNLVLMVNKKEKRVLIVLGICTRNWTLLQRFCKAYELFISLRGWRLMLHQPRRYATTLKPCKECWVLVYILVIDTILKIFRCMHTYLLTLREIERN